MSATVEDDQRRLVDPKGKVRVTLRMQWDTTIASFEIFIPMEFVTEISSKELFEHFMPDIFDHTLADLKEKSVKRMMLENGVS